MEDAAHSSYSHYHHSPSNNASPHVTSAQDHVPDASGSTTNGAKYRLMSPAKLPISRSTSITIPPGLSPTSFLESPVLLSNIKAEPSPTTGSFFKPQLMQGSGENASLSLDKFFSSGKAVDEKTSNSFEFRFQTGASSTSGLSSTGLSFHVGMNRQAPVIYQGQHNSQLPAPSSQASQSLVVSTHNSPICSSIDELSQGGQSNTGALASSASEHKDSISSVSNERTSEDGYNWRKYGQKLVKGSEFPRSYYKCTYPNCEVKKIFERSPSGQITEIVYKGSHDHPKPQAARRQNSGALLSFQEDKLDKDLSFGGQEDKTTNNKMDQNGSPMLSPLQANEDIDGSGSQYQILTDDIEEDDPFLKRRKMEDGIDVTPVVKPIREPRVVVQTLSEVDILDDGYRWRKYGQKVVRGNPNPRSYYKCTNVGCPVRKHVERASHDPKAVITTYEGKHNHDVPTAKNNNNNNNNSSHDYSGAAQYAGNSNMRPQDSNSGSISLDLGVGIGRVGENRNNELVQVLDAEDVRTEIGIVNGGFNNMYGNRENRVEGRSFQTPPIHPSNQCQPNLGRILMGP